ncbi:MAG: UDP-N-acetylglucosamine 1-carboxyvinyltransferase [Candidatus Brocadia sp. AMX2]|uniref:UDP-N-acetylglucosamine 1-carboxyvinyltransferase n=1 Tax=Candidatus Brocadia sinica JPN1 TaxID=1197129 RepID=A0ABQ0JYY8_9BACT|nr:MULTISPECIES: UDP-N-acetylglucosamine 1-carboxyvinyltransferase [Brocadia]KXK31737.1 MAG: UDP-N-acetylglucosamine 1-carboxyvinyltransferase [Candidatus Brocadia sinica]MBC6932200.1 UDP-N-acetylglucosamine 1-carboxyvinyltransferase [Candidatus Brocadia sp.]MBL1168472.1 UDP-N-acetylglucosamine 1-carboxyvinyltransferase [Candidatus Brocadia sp. AMX1]NOG40245.1 UDP-N-acetylglucosamine 1-carboxyvinyltransferase [Planctomycetota bacterium]KAA0243641.1 MAG: UDP-N-acetylglucosamine 1-carboxyvinyltr
MDKIVIEGGNCLEGSARINGAKNAALPIMAACLLLNGPSRIKGIPNIVDIQTQSEILRNLGGEVKKLDDETLEIIFRDGENSDKFTAPYELVRKMRASICVLGPLLSKRRRAKVSYPGGCVIGQRPIDLHIKGLSALGAQIETTEGYVNASADKLVGTNISFTGKTVLGTCNVMTAAVLAEGTTTIEYAACEPEVQDLANFLNKAGAKITGIGESKLTIEGVQELRGVDYEIIPDRIEAGTFMIASAITRGDITLQNVRADHLSAVIDKLRETGVEITITGNEIRVKGNTVYHAVDLMTVPYPGMPTDMQAQFMALLCIVEGKSIITEKIFPDRFIHAAELRRMGADIRVDGPSAIIRGAPFLSGTEVMVSDLRAGAGLVLAGLVAKGTTHIHRVYHLDRGYERLEDRLSKLGAAIKRVRV